MISTDSASATIARKRRLSALDTLERAVDGRDARPLHEVVTDNLRAVWRNGGSRRDDKPGRWPEAFRIRDGFVATTAEDAHGPALPRLIQSKGLQLRLYLLMLFEAQCRHETGEKVGNVRTISTGTGLYRSWSELVLSAPDHKEKPAQPVASRMRRRRERQIKEAMQALEITPRLLNIARTTVGRARRDFDKPTLLAEDSNPDAQARYTVAEEHFFSVPYEFVTNLWIFTLTDAEIACYLALRWAQQAFPASAQGDFVLQSADREMRLRLTRTTWDSVQHLQAYGLIQRTDIPDRDPISGTITSFRDKWQAGEVAPVHYAFTPDGAQRPALGTIRHALQNPVLPVRPEPMEILFNPAAT